MAEGRGWVGFDLDGTLAYYDGWKGYAHIGEPIPAMVAALRTYLDAGFPVRIFTARADHPLGVSAVEDWCLEHIGVRLPVTNVKDFACVTIYDDRAVQVESNTGRIVKDG